MFYEACEFCPILEGRERIKMLPFGNGEEVAVAVPNFHRLTDDEKRELAEKYPGARFLGFPACANVEDIEGAELACGILLRNETRQFRKFLLYKSVALTQLFQVTETSFTSGDGAKFLTYSGRVGDADFTKEYERIING